MDERTCAIDGCGAPLRARGWCTHHYNRFHRYGDPLGGPSHPTACEHCGGELPPPGRTGPQARYCSRTCREQAQYLRIKPRRDKRQAEKRAERPDRECAWCGTTIAGSENARRIYCSRRCNQNANRDSSGRTCIEADCDRPERAKGLCAHHYRKQHPNRKQWKTGDPETRRRNLRRKTQLRRARMLDPNAEPIDRDEIGKRDGWRCGLCSQRVNNTLAWPHPMSPSLDHIEPLSLGGKHVRENVQISHLTCNTAKSNRGGGEQLLLIG